MKEVILYKIAYFVSKFTYYDRKGDKQLSIKQLTDAVNNDVVTVDEIVGAFKRGILEALNNN